MVMTLDIPPAVAVCPECGGWLYIDNYDDLVEEDGKIGTELVDGGMIIFCSEEDRILDAFDKEHPDDDELRRQYEHRAWQSDWQPVHDVVKEWLLVSIVRRKR
jgi:hypothetical protein